MDSPRSLDGLANGREDAQKYFGPAKLRSMSSNGVGLVPSTTAPGGLGYLMFNSPNVSVKSGESSGQNKLLERRIKGLQDNLDDLQGRLIDSDVLVQDALQTVTRLEVEKGALQTEVNELTEQLERKSTEVIKFESNLKEAFTLLEKSKSVENQLEQVEHVLQKQRESKDSSCHEYGDKNSRGDANDQVSTSPVSCQIDLDGDFKQALLLELESSNKQVSELRATIETLQEESQLQQEKLNVLQESANDTKNKYTRLVETHTSQVEKFQEEIQSLEAENLKLGGQVEAIQSFCDENTRKKDLELSELSELLKFKERILLDVESQHQVLVKKMEEELESSLGEWERKLALQVEMTVQQARDAEEKQAAQAQKALTTESMLEKKNIELTEELVNTREMLQKAKDESRKATRVKDETLQRMALEVEQVRAKANDEHKQLETDFERERTKLLLAYETSNDEIDRLRLELGHITHTSEEAKLEAMKTSMDCNNQLVVLRERLQLAETSCEAAKVESHKSQQQIRRLKLQEQSLQAQVIEGNIAKVWREQNEARLVSVNQIEIKLQREKEAAVTKLKRELEELKINMSSSSSLNQSEKKARERVEDLVQDLKDQVAQALQERDRFREGKNEATQKLHEMKGELKRAKARLEQKLQEQPVLPTAGHSAAKEPLDSRVVYFLVSILVLLLANLVFLFKS